MRRTERKPYSKGEKWFLAAILLLSTGLGLGYLSEIRGTGLLEHLRLDELFHNNWAVSIAGGNILGDEIFFRAPLYAYWLGMIFALFGHSYIVPRIIQHLLGTGTVFLVYLLARNIFGRKTAAIASVLAATYAALIYNEDKFLFESILLFQLLLFFLLYYNIREKPSFINWAILGAVFGLICITRPIFLPCGLLFLTSPIWLYQKSSGLKKALLLAAGFCAGAAVVIAPVTVRNYVVGREFELIASQGGINFYIGNNPAADGFSSTMPGDPGSRWEYRDLKHSVPQESSQLLSPSKVDKYWLNKGLDFVRGAPLNFILLTLKKLYLFWNQTEIPNNGSLYFYSEFSRILTLLPTGFWLVGPLGAAGMWLAWRDRRGRTVVLFIISYMMLVILFFVCDRFRLPAVPFFCIFAAFALVKISGYIKSRDKSRLLRSGLMLGSFAFLTNSNFYHFTKGNPASDMFNLGNMELSAGNYTAAASYYDKCTQAGAVIQDASLNWGVAEWKLGRLKNAAQKFHNELSDFPRSYDAILNLAHLHYTGRRTDSAEYYAKRAVALRPYAPGGYLELAFAYTDRQLFDRAESTLVLCLNQIGPNSLYEESVLAGVHLMQGKDSLAEKEYRSILNRLKFNRQPGYEPEYQYSQGYKLGGTIGEFQAKVFYSLGHILLGRGQADSAALYLRLSSAQLPEFPDSWIDLGIALHASGNFAGADSSFREGLRLFPGNFQAWYNYGLLLKSAGKTTDAEQAFQKTLTLNPGFEEAEHELKSVNR